MNQPASASHVSELSVGENRMREIVMRTVNKQTNERRRRVFWHLLSDTFCFMRFHYRDEASGSGPEGLCARQIILLSGAHATSQASNQPPTQCLSLGAKWLGVAELSPPSAQVKNAWNCTAFPSCLHLVVLIKHRQMIAPRFRLQ
jgi:hypothetical protein